MTLRQIERLKELRTLRETLSRVRLAKANQEQAQIEAERDRAFEAARAVEAELPERNRQAISAVVAEGAKPSTLARMTLQYQIGQDDLVKALRQAAQMKRQADQRQALTAAARVEWSGRAKDVRKLDLLIEKNAGARHQTSDSET